MAKKLAKIGVRTELEQEATYTGIKRCTQATCASYWFREGLSFFRLQLLKGSGLPWFLFSLVAQW